MPAGHADLRVLRTRKLLREALAVLVQEKNFEALTVREITARAMVSRAAFYRNYRDKYELVERIFGEVMAPLMGAHDRSSPATPRPAANPPQAWIDLFRHIDQNEHLYLGLLGPRGSRWFAARMKESLVAMMDRHLPARDGDPAAHAFVRELIAAVQVEAIALWLQKGRPYTAEQMASRCGRLASAVLNEARSWGSLAPRRGTAERRRP